MCFLCVYIPPRTGDGRPLGKFSMFFAALNLIEIIGEVTTKEKNTALGRSLPECALDRLAINGKRKISLLVFSDWPVDGNYNVLNTPKLK